MAHLAVQIGCTLLLGCGLAAAGMAAEHWQPGSDWETYNKSLEGQLFAVERDQRIERR